MSKRITVLVKQTFFDVIDMYCKNKDISVAAFSRKIGKHNRWISEVKRGRNLPSPEEAAQMCLLLHTTPEEILLTEGETAEETARCQEDIVLVRKLLDEMQEAKKAPAIEGEGSKEAASNFIKATSDRAALLAIINEATKKLQELE